MEAKVKLGGFSSTKRALFKLRTCALVLRCLLPVVRPRRHGASLARRAKGLLLILRFAYRITRFPAETLALWVWHRRMLLELRRTPARYAGRSGELPARGFFSIETDDELLVKSRG